MESAGVVWAVILLVAIPLLGIVAAPWLVYPITKFVGVAAYLFYCRCSSPVEHRHPLPPARSIGECGHAPCDMMRTKWA
jgi:hypothetical protein